MSFVLSSSPQISGFLWVNHMIVEFFTDENVDDEDEGEIVLLMGFFLHKKQTEFLKSSFNEFIELLKEIKDPLNEGFFLIFINNFI